MIMIHDIVRFKKSNNELYKTFGKNGQTFEVVAAHDKFARTYFALRNTKTNSITKWIGESVIERVSE